ncbi:MAG TPA: SAM-dependent DNA methyltransferase [Methanosarcinales archaeon]|nr:SAM-dependent DNA methyltransferase [Methanosarcinales archaeon]
MVSRKAINERVFQGRVLTWINEIIEKKDLSLGGADQEISIKKGEKEYRFPDLVIYEDKERTKVAAPIEIKPPEYNGYALNLVNKAREKADLLGAPYFATWNVNHFVLWETFKKGTHPLDRRRWFYKVADLKNIKEVDRIEEAIKKFLEKFLDTFVEIYYVEKKLPALPLDRMFIDMLRARVDTFYIPISEKIKEEFYKNKRFSEQLVKWFVEQSWIFQGIEEDFDRIAKQYTHLFINKILFYYALKAKYPHLPVIKIPTHASLREGQFKRMLQSYFDECLDIDYQTVFSTDFIDNITLPNELIDQLRDFIEEMSLYDFSEIGYDILGSVFENLIPKEERHKLGQYFTNSYIVDIIVGFCVNGNSKVLDPSCGAGTFLSRAYERKKFLIDIKNHKDILEDLYGVDIAKFPSHLSTINLVIKDLSERENYPKILNKDFFDIKPKTPIAISTSLAQGLDKRTFEIEIPYLDAVITNPPYTRQEEMEDYFEGLKEKLQNIAKKECGFRVSKRSSIYSYFFFHCAKFLKNNGRLGLITSNSWLDVDYGKYLQEFFLQNFKILAIIESKVERWFEDADINTAITILEKCNNEKEREYNLVKFVQLKKPLKEFIKATDNENARWESIGEFIGLIKGHNEYYEDDRIRIYPKKQLDLWEEGLDENREYSGSKWGKYLRAPNIFFKILEKGKDLFVPLKEVAEVKFGIKTGANEFFYLTEEDIKQWNIEPEFLKPVIKSPRECESILINPNNLKYKILMVHKEREDLEGTNVLKYIEWGEEQGFHERVTCKSRKKWYDLVERNGIILWSRTHNVHHRIFYNDFKVFIADTFSEFNLKKEINSKVMCAIFNSYITALFKEIGGRNVFGQGALGSLGTDIISLPVLNLAKLSKSQIQKLESAFTKLCNRPIGSVFEEIGANNPNEVSLDKVKPDRLELDNIVFDILGLTANERLEVYKAVVDLVRSRIDKAKSIDKKKSIKGIDLNTLVEVMLKEIGKIKKFPEDYIGKSEVEIIKVPKGKAEVFSDIHGFHIKIGNKELICKSPYEAKYIQYATMNKKTSIKIPKYEKIIKKVVEEYSLYLDKVKNEINGLLQYRIPDSKIKEKVKNELWRYIFA